MTDAEALSAWLDRLAVQDVILRYSDAATRGDWAAFELLWTDDAIWELPPPMETRVVGPRAITEAVSAAVDAQDFFVQMTHGSVVTLHGGGRAAATTTIQALGRRTGANHVVNIGVYYDDLAKDGDTWKFTHRRLQPVYMDMTELPGNAPISRADLAARG